MDAANVGHLNLQNVKYNNEFNIFNDFYITECLLSDRSDVFNMCFIKFIQEAWEIRNNILGSAL